MLFLVAGMLDNSSWDQQIADDFHESTATWRCCDHRAQLAVLDAIEEASDMKVLVDAVREIVKFIRASPDRVLQLKQIQERRIKLQQQQSQPDASNSSSVADSDGQDSPSSARFRASSSASASSAPAPSSASSSSAASPFPSSSPQEPDKFVSVLSPAEARRQRDMQYSSQKIPLRLILDCPTRWMTVHSMIDR